MKIPDKRNGPPKSVTTCGVDPVSACIGEDRLSRSGRMISKDSMAIRNIIYTFLFAGIIGPALYLRVDFGLTGGCMREGLNGFMGINSKGIGYIFVASLIGMIIWLIAYREDSRRRTTALIVIGFVAVMIFSSAPTVMK